WISAAHACLAHAFFCVMVSLAVFTAVKWGPVSAVHIGGADRSEKLAMITNAAIFLQLLVGAGYRHNGLGMNWHLVGAVLVAGAVYHTVFHALRHASKAPGVL